MTAGDLIQLQEKLQRYGRLLNSLDESVRNDYLETLSLSFTHNTVAIEGNRCTLPDAVRILKYATVPQNQRPCDVVDLFANDRARELLFQLNENKEPVTQDIICRFHREVLWPSRYAGVYRNFNVMVLNSMTPVADYTEIYRKMALYEERLKADGFRDPAEKAAFTHCEFVKIHPFADGNGRTARLIMNLSLMNDGFPLLNIRSEKTDLTRYMDAIQSYCLGEGTEAFRSFLISETDRQITSFMENYENADLHYDLTKLRGVLFIQNCSGDSDTDWQIGRIEGARYNADHGIWSVPVTERERVKSLNNIRIYDTAADFLTAWHSENRKEQSGTDRKGFSRGR